MNTLVDSIVQATSLDDLSLLYAEAKNLAYSSEATEQLQALISQKANTIDPVKWADMVDEYWDSVADSAE